MAAAVLIATGGGFAQSYSGLYEWALEHGLSGWKAASFPLLVDLFIIVGELGLFLLALDAYAIRKSLLSWMDFMLPLFIALAGWTASLVFNVGHVLNREFSYQATAAVPPIVSMLGLFVLLRTLHRYVVQTPDQPEQEERALEASPEPRQITASAVRVAELEAPAEQLADPIMEAAKAAEKAEKQAAEQPVAERVAEKVAEKVPGPPETPAEQTFVDLLPTEEEDKDEVGGVFKIKPQPDPTSMRTIVTEALNRHTGDVVKACEDLAAEGYAIDKSEVAKIRENHWFPYFAYRLVAKHGPDGKLVAQELTELGVEFDKVALRDLVRNWRA